MHLTCGRIITLLICRHLNISQIETLTSSTKTFPAIENGGRVHRNLSQINVLHNKKDLRCALIGRRDDLELYVRLGASLCPVVQASNEAATARVLPSIVWALRQDRNGQGDAF
jgi:hypothetical protein